MWVVLLDQSGSMGDPFASASHLDDRRVRRTEQEIKLDAAKESILIELSRNPDMPVAIFGFTTTARLIYEGAAGDSFAIGTNLARVAARGGTDIAAALDAAAAWAGPPQDRPTVTSIILVSDGLSNAAAAAAAADRCRTASLAIYVILIDPDDDTAALAARLARLTGGRWDPVTSQQDLAAATTHRAADAAAQVQLAEAVTRLMEQEAEAVAAEVAGRERVQFTASYPGIIAASGSYPLTVFLHLANMMAELEERIRRLSTEFGPYVGRSSAVTGSIIERGRIVELRPVLANLRCVPARSDVVWQERLEEIRFGIEYVGPDQQEAICGGHVEVRVDGLIAAQIPVSITMTTDRDATALPQPRHSTAEMLRRVFASYAHDDEDIVRRCKSAYRALGIHLFVDRDDIESGELWWPLIQKMIASHDLFQLYWSASAAASQVVAHEWGLALQVAKTKPMGTDFIRPVYWQRPMPRPPAVLSPIHFRYLDPQSLGQVADAVGTPRERHVPAGGDMEVRFPVLVCASDPTGETTGVIRRALQSVVPFVERVTGLRYYPPATLLVDELIVAQARRTSEVDRRHEPSDTAVLLELLGSLCLAFHVGAHLEGDYFGRSLADSLRPLDRGDFRHVAREGEGRFVSLVSQWLGGTDPLTESSRATFAAVLDQARGNVNDRFPSWDLADNSGRLLAVTTVEDRSRLAALLGNLVWDGDEGLEAVIQDGALRQELVKRAGEEEFMLIAARYDSVLHHCFDQQPTTLPTTSFPAYAARFMELLVGFVAMAEERLGDDEFENGYSVGGRVLAWIDRHHPGIVRTRSQATWNRNGETQYTWRMTRSGYRALLADVCRRVLAEIESGGPRWMLVRTAAPTYGAFTLEVADAGSPVRQAIERGGLSGSLLPPDSPAVLICSDAFDRLLTSLRDQGIEPDRARDQATAFLFTTLVHEHFHAALASGVDSDGHAPAGAADPGQWQAASHLNEALSAWAQRHAVRDDPDLFAQCSTYIGSGEYPDWPYRGADALEREYQERGIAAIRARVTLLRVDPEIAQQDFDQAITQAGPLGSLASPVLDRPL